MFCTRSVVLGLVFAFVVFGQESSRPLRVAIYNFDDSSVKENIRLEIGRNVDYGKIAADMLLSKLVSNKIEVINRDQMEHLLAEQNLKFSDRFDSSQAVQFGKLLNVDAIVTGQIEQLFTEAKQDQGGFIGLGHKKSTVTATVTITSKMISTATAKVLAAPNFTSTETAEVGTETQVPSNTKIRIPGMPTGATSAATGSKTTTKTSTDPYIRKALADAIDKVGRDLVRVAPTIPQLELARATPPKPRDRGSERASASQSATAANAAAPAYIPVEDEVGTVMKVDAETLTFSLAPDVAVNVGDKLEIQKVEFVPDPRSGKTIPLGEKVGTLEVTEVHSAYSRGTFTGKDIEPKLRVVAVKNGSQRARTPAPKPNNNASAATPPAGRRTTERAKPPVTSVAPGAKTIPTP